MQDCFERLIESFYLLFFKACTKTRNTGTPEHSGIAQITGTAKKTRNTEFDGVVLFSHYRSCKKFDVNVTKHLMTGHKGNSEFCFPETLNIEVEGKQNSLFPEGPVIKCFVIPPDSKIEKTPKKIICLRPLHTLAALAKLSGCQN